MSDIRDRFVAYFTLEGMVRPQCEYRCDDRLVLARGLADDEVTVWVIEHAEDCPGIQRHPAT